MSVAERLAGPIAAALEDGTIQSKADLQRIKQRLVRDHGLQGLPRDADIAAALPVDVRDRHAALLRKKPMRSGSGVAVVAVMSSPAACPHGKCVYCPGGPEVDAPQSYTGFEPSTMRAKRYAYDAYRIVRSRLAQLSRNGHAIDKVDVVVQGGTFPARDQGYRDAFIASIYQACNDGPDPDPVALAQRPELDGAMAANESAPCRVIGLTIETKPDWCFPEHIDEMLRYGTTRVEIGIQTLDEEVTRLTNRGHTVADGVTALAAARNAGLKVCIHLMPGLPRPDPARPRHYRTDPDADIEDMRDVFRDPAWRPDMLKVYPTLVVHEGDTPLKRWWQEGRYRPYSTDEARAVIAAGLRDVPRYCRIQRIDRDIPTTHIEAGVDKSNLRQLVEEDMEAAGTPLQDIRSREVYRRPGGAPGDVVMHRLEYDAAGGREVFLSMDAPGTDALAAFIRVRLGASSHRPELAGATAIIRELKVYGTAVPIGADPGEHAWQHRGAGTALVEAGEDEARSGGCERMAVLAGPGVKPYYRRFGYADAGPYLVKPL